MNFVILGGLEIQIWEIVFYPTEEAFKGILHDFISLLFNIQKIAKALYFSYLIVPLKLAHIKTAWKQT